MSAAKHTEGPWTVSVNPSYPHELAIDTVINGVTIHIALVHVVPGPDEVTHANAAVMAAAPNMLAKLRDVLKECGECSGKCVLGVAYPEQGLQVGDPCPQCEDIREVIALAEGRQS